MFVGFKKEKAEALLDLKDEFTYTPKKEYNTEYNESVRWIVEVPIK